MKFNVFVYGTLKKGYKLHFYLKNAKFIGYGYVNGYDMYIVDWYPAVVKGRGRVYGEVYEVCQETLDILDGVEEEGFLYKRICEKVYMKKGFIKAYMYVYLKDVSQLKRVPTGIFK